MTGNADEGLPPAARDVLDFWFPDDGHGDSAEAHRDFWTWRMRGKAEEAIKSRFADVTRAAARGELDDWAASPRGRLALIIVLDQFSRSFWAGEAAAFGQDIKTTRLVMEAFDNGHYEALPKVWERQFYLIAVTHCEGPDHLARMDRMATLNHDLARQAPEHLRLLYLMSVEQTLTVRDVIARFGRHPHRNAVLGRVSTVAEEAYLAKGAFPHQRQMPSSEDEIMASLKARGIV